MGVLLLYYTLSHDPETILALNINLTGSLEACLIGKHEKGEIDFLELNVANGLPKNDFDARILLDKTLRTIISSLQHQCCSLRTLKFDWIPPFFPLGFYLGHILAHNASITSLSVNRHVVGEDELKAIGQGLAQNRSVKDMDLRLCNISGRGVRTLLDNAVGNSTLTFVDFSQNHIVNEEYDSFGELNGFVLRKEGGDDAPQFYLERNIKKPISTDCAVLDAKGSKLTEGQQKLIAYTPNYRATKSDKQTATLPDAAATSKKRKCK